MINRHKSKANINTEQYLLLAILSQDETTNCREVFLSYYVTPRRTRLTLTLLSFKNIIL